MKLWEYLDEKWVSIFGNILACLALSFYLFGMGLDFNALLLVWIVWAGMLVLKTGMGYGLLKKQITTLEKQIDGLDQAYLISELLEKPQNVLEKSYYQLLKRANKSMTEEVGKARGAYRDYKEYIEEWIHEIKTPISAIDLICKNHPGREISIIRKELAHIDYLVEQALFYARSENVEKDYFIRECALSEAVQPALMNFRTTLLEEKIRIQVEELEEIVYTDEKWLTYMVSQILSNAIKYHNDKQPQIKIYCQKADKGTYLYIEDNGIGMEPSELSSIFEKGFTGKDRKNQKSTGMGLYLCKKLCGKLGLSIRAESASGQGTRIILGFPMGELHKPTLTNL